MREMPYMIVFATRNTHDVSAADATTAREALTITEALQNRDGKIKFIRSPQEGEFGVEMLRLLAKEEEEEMRIAPDSRPAFARSERAPLWFLSKTPAQRPTLADYIKKDTDLSAPSSLPPKLSR
jgi:hypothetical protein